MKLLVRPVPAHASQGLPEDHVVIVGFGLAGRYVADLLDRASVSYTIIETNAETVETQRALGRCAVLGDGADAKTLIQAGLDRSAVLALTMPDQEAVLQAVRLARRLCPDLYIVARTEFSSQGLRACELGADEVVNAEQAVALQFYERLSRRLGRRSQAVNR